MFNKYIKGLKSFLVRSCVREPSERQRVKGFVNPCNESWI